MAKIKDYSNADLLLAFEMACYRLVNYPNSKTTAKRFVNLEKELAKRLNITDEELEVLQGNYKENENDDERAVEDSQRD